MALPAIPRGVLNLLVTELQKIGTGVAGTWLTNAVVAKDVPSGALPVPDRPRIYVVFDSEEPRDEELPLGQHGERIIIHVWVTARTIDALLDADWDVKHALRDAEAAMGANYSTLQENGGFQRKRDLEQAGLYVGVRSVVIPIDYSHAAF